ncbi:conserved hypothetical protein [Tenacibaculum sp. 190524A05c]|uniref:hypothetical protein n=1 Tax=Tenacibaculum platacis TaxID=3137852 RepID=UPI0031FA7FE9
MEIIFACLVFFLVLGKFLGNAVKSAMPEEKFYDLDNNFQDSPTVINNTYIQNNLHITEEQLEELKRSSKS